MDELIKKLAPLGVTGLVWVVAVGASAGGLVGAAAITATLAALGPGGMIGGIATLVIITAISGAIVDYGFDAVFCAVLKEQLKTKTKQQIIYEIRRKKLFTKRMKDKAVGYVENVEIK